jgi:hypothetical protein
MIALLSKDYFSSDWCVHELDLIMERAGGNDLIIPNVVHDGQAIPDAVDQLQSADFKNYAIPALSHGGRLYAEFWSTLVGLAPRIGNAIETAPDYDPRWEPIFRQRLADVDAAARRGNRLPPNRFTLKISAPAKSPPRMSV